MAVDKKNPEPNDYYSMPTPVKTARKNAAKKFNKNWMRPKTSDTPKEREAFYKLRGERVKKALEKKYGPNWKEKVYGPDFSQKKLQLINAKKAKVADRLSLNARRQENITKALESTTDENKKSALQARLEKIQGVGEKLTSRQEKIQSRIQEKYTSKRKDAARKAVVSSAGKAAQEKIDKYADGMKRVEKVKRVEADKSNTQPFSYKNTKKRLEALRNKKDA